MISGILDGWAFPGLLVAAAVLGGAVLGSVIAHRRRREILARSARIAEARYTPLTEEWPW